MGEALVDHIPTKKNLADLFTKVLYGQTHRFLVDRILWDMFPSDQMPHSPLARVQLMTGPCLWEAAAMYCQSGDCCLVSLLHFAKPVR
jgi:hypothetical protein